MEFTVWGPGLAGSLVFAGAGLAWGALALWPGRVWLAGPANRSLALLFALAVGPLGLAVWLYCLFWFLPGRPDWVYPALAFLPPALGLLLAPRRLAGLPLLAAERARAAARLAGREKFWAGALLAALLLVAVKAVAFPLVADDALNYALVSRELAATKSLVNYPMLYEGARGLLVGQKHPPGQMLLYALARLAAGDQLGDLWTRAGSLYYFLLLVCTTAALIRRRGGSPRAALLGACLCLGLPLLVNQAILNTLDPARLALFLLGAGLYGLYLAEGRAGLAWAGGTAAAAALFTHLSMLLLPVVVAGAAGLESLRARRRRAAAGFSLGLVALTLALSLAPAAPYFWKLFTPPAARPEAAVAGPGRVPARLAAPQATLGLFVGKYERADHSRLPAAERDWAFTLDRLADAPEHLLNRLGGRLGTRLGPFTRVLYFSGVYWLGLGLLWATARRQWPRDAFYRGSLIQIGLVFLLVTPFQYANPRFILTGAPLVVVFCGLAWQAVAESPRQRRRPWTRLWPAVLGLCLVTGLAVAGWQKGDLRLADAPTWQQLRQGARDFLGAPDYYRLLHWLEFQDPDREEKILCFRAAPFFYYTHRQGVAYRFSPLTRDLFTAVCGQDLTPRELARALRARGIHRILDDPNYATYIRFRESCFPDLLASRLVRVVRRSGLVTLWELVPGPDEAPPSPPAPATPTR
ncbi:MAG: hypothetical protein KQJ78_11550 [Deltaproteobacteria bacterium]|nr:hypothetical protein [Deltaproteobacteria bacterium]